MATPAALAQRAQQVNPTHLAHLAAGWDNEAMLSRIISLIMFIAVPQKSVPAESRYLFKSGGIN